MAVTLAVLKKASISMLSRFPDGSAEYEEMYAKLIHASEHKRAKKKKKYELLAPRPKREVAEIARLHNRISAYIYKNGYLTAGQISKELKIPIGSANHHLRSMVGKGFVIKSRMKKRQLNYSHWIYTLPTDVVKSVNYKEYLLAP